ncbi:MAG: TIGR01777 family oxidoreductase [Sphingobacteriia bacterium]|jgi:uncharacterized protein (TIGR01777 family)
MPTVLITGGTGTVGKRLTQLLLSKGYNVNILSRAKQKAETVQENKAKGKIAYFNWDLTKKYIDPLAISSADFIVHLAGAGVADKRWTEQRKKEILLSRTQSCDLLVSSLKEVPNKITAVISASAIGWYGPDNANYANAPFTETAASYKDFLGETCQLWEDAISPIAQLDKRLVILRTGIVLSNEGGALVEFKKPILFKTAAVLGNGKQMISWIHVDDLCNQYIFAIENQQMDGVFNAVAPNPVSNEKLTLALAKKMAGSFFLKIHVPAFLLKMVLGEMSIEVLKSTTVSAQKIQTMGYQFNFPTIDTALETFVNH